MSWELCRRPRTILRVLVKPGFSGRLFTRLSLHVDDCVILARLGRLILHVCPIYSHLHAARWRVLDECRIPTPFNVVTSLKAERAAQPTLAVSAEKNEVELCRTVRYTRRAGRHSLSDRDRFESQRLTR